MAKRKLYRYTFEVDCPSEEQKALFSDHVESVRQKMEGLEGSRRLNKLELLSYWPLLRLFQGLKLAKLLRKPGLREL